MPAFLDEIFESDGQEELVHLGKTVVADLVSTRLALSGPYVVRQAKDIYQFVNEIGKGSYGSVYKAMHKDTHGTYAIKSVPAAVKRDRREDVSLVKSLDHPNIIKFFESFGDHLSTQLVMECCEGGTVSERLADVGYFAEDQTRALMRQMLYAVGYLHQNRICHRDLKPGNLLLQTKDSSQPSVLKIADFGLARRFQRNRPLTTQVGTLAFCAPELLKGRYHTPCDLWSCGVTMYLLMSGTLPFNGHTEATLTQAVCRGNYVFWGKPWEDASDKAKDVIRGLLRYSDNERLSSEDALQHAYFTRDEGLPAHELESLARRLRAFSHQSPLQKAALQVLARQVDGACARRCGEVFAAFDADGSGSVTAAGLKAAFVKAGLDALLPALQPSLDCLCPISYTDFLAMAVDEADCIEDSVCREAFRILDRDCDGLLSTEDLDGVVGVSSVQANGKIGTNFEDFAETLAGSFKSSGMRNLEDTPQRAVITSL
jgi:calcium-dependent protein kinase